MENVVNKIVETINGVSITLRQVMIYAKRFGINPSDETQYPGVIGSLAGWVSDVNSKDADAYVLESTETRDEFKAIRDAFNTKISGAPKPDDQLSNVSMKEVVADWDEFAATLPKDEEKAA